MRWRATVRRALKTGRTTGYGAMALCPLVARGPSFRTYLVRKFGLMHYPQRPPGIECGRFSASQGDSSRPLPLETHLYGLALGGLRFHCQVLTRQCFAG